jgi:RNA polymerase sigma-70 factor, ECF subfamily
MPDPTQQPALDEQELLRRANELDQDALAVIFDLYYEPIYRYIYRHLRHAETAEDLTADVFRVLLEKLNTKNGPNRFLKAWLYKVAQNSIIDEVRRNKYRQADVIDDEHQDDSQVVAPQVERLLQRKAVRQAMRRLTGKQQSVLYLRYFQGLKQIEIAYALDMTVETVKALQYRGLHALRRSLTQFDKFDLEE